MKHFINMGWGMTTEDFQIYLKAYAAEINKRAVTYVKNSWPYDLMLALDNQTLDRQNNHRTIIETLQTYFLLECSRLHAPRTQLVSTLQNIARIACMTYGLYEVHMI